MKKLIIAGVLATTCMFAPAAWSQETMPARQTIRYFTISLEKELTREVELVSITVPPGGGNPFHRHPGDQWTAVQDGEVTFTIKGQPPSRAQRRRTGTNYYFANAGNDFNPCSSAAPCQTLHKINTITFQPGDTINLNGGDTFTDNSIYLTISACNANNPVVLQSYGTGRATIAPTVAINTSSPALFEAYNECGITLDNLAWVATASVAWKNGIVFGNGNATMLDPQGEVTLQS
jgi:Cupin domain